MNKAVANRRYLKLPAWSENSTQFVFAVSAICCLLAGIVATSILSAYFEQRIFTLIIFSALQLLPLFFALRLPSSLAGRIQWMSVTLYFLIALLANSLFPQFKLHLAWIFLVLCAVITLLASASAGMAFRTVYKRMIQRHH